ncbi:DegT/DnrJ/EryC1/StrS family aminotransferase, partial [Vibrio parahaemolyticus]
RIDEFSKKRQEIAKRYVDELSILNENVRVLDFNYNEIIPHIFVIKVTDRDLLREHLISKGIECGVHYKPNHLLE